MEKLYIFVCDSCEWEDILIFDNQNEAQNYLEEQKKLYPTNNNFRIEIFQKNNLNHFISTYNTLN
jgi:uncharacterized phage-like protein YoqJ